MRSTWPGGGILLVSLWLAAGCTTVGPDYRPPEVATPEAWQTPAGTVAEPRADWWAVFGDPALTALVTEVSASNRSLAAAAARLDSYAAAVGMVRSGFYPQLGAQGGLSWDRQSERVHVPVGYEAAENPGWLYQAGFTMAWELDLWGRVRRSLEAARGELDAALEDLRHLQIVLQAQVASEYLGLRAVQQRLAFARQNVALQRATLAVVRGRYEAGLTGELDVRQAEMNLAATTAQVPPMEVRQTEALNALCVLTGRLPGELRHLLEPAEVPAATTLPGQVPAELLRRRPDLRAAERALAAQTARIGVAKAEFYPLLALNGSFTVASSYSHELRRKAAQDFGLGPSLTWSIFTAGRVQHQVQAEEAATRAALAQYEQTVLTAYGECEDALAAFAHEGARLAALRDASRAAEQAVTLVDEQYRSGLVTFQHVLDAQRQLAQHQDALAQSMGQSGISLVAVYKAFGGGW